MYLHAIKTRMNSGTPLVPTHEWGEDGIVITTLIRSSTVPFIV